MRQIINIISHNKGIGDIRKSLTSVTLVGLELHIIIGLFHKCHNNHSYNHNPDRLELWYGLMIKEKPTGQFNDNNRRDG